MRLFSAAARSVVTATLDGQITCLCVCSGLLGIRVAKAPGDGKVFARGNALTGVVSRHVSRRSARRITAFAE